MWFPIFPKHVIKIPGVAKKLWSKEERSLII
jgi:hypothetical protein